MTSVKQEIKERVRSLHQTFRNRGEYNHAEFIRAALVECADLKEKFERAFVQSIADEVNAEPLVIPLASFSAEEVERAKKHIAQQGLPRTDGYLEVVANLLRTLPSVQPV